jgi:hypothetical protein
MLADVQAHFGLARPFHRVGNYETEHQRTLVREVCAVVQTGCVSAWKIDPLRRGIGVEN